MSWVPMTPSKNWALLPTQPHLSLPLALIYLSWEFYILQDQDIYRRHPLFSHQHEHLKYGKTVLNQEDETGHNTLRSLRNATKYLYSWPSQLCGVCICLLESTLHHFLLLRPLQRFEIHSVLRYWCCIFSVHVQQEQFVYRVFLFLHECQEGCAIYSVS